MVVMWTLLSAQWIGTLVVLALLVFVAPSTPPIVWRRSKAHSGPTTPRAQTATGEIWQSVSTKERRSKRGRMMNFSCWQLYCNAYCTILKETFPLSQSIIIIIIKRYCFLQPKMLHDLSLRSKFLVWWRSHHHGTSWWNNSSWRIHHRIWILRRICSRWISLRRISLRISSHGRLASIANRHIHNTTAKNK